VHATFGQSGPALTDAVRGIRGTFYPVEGPSGGGSAGSALAKVAIVIVALAVARNIIGRGGARHGGSMMGRRRQMIAELHRELHAEDAAAPDAPAKA
jgi:hypothetical protein